LGKKKRKPPAKARTKKAKRPPKKTAARKSRSRTAAGGVPVPQAQTTSAAEQIDNQLAKKALQTRNQGGTPTRDQLAALRRVEKRREENDRWSYYRSIPQKHWRQMSGKHARQIIDQATRYGLPFGGAAIDLTAVVPALHRFLADNAAALSSDDGLLGGPDTPSLERLRLAQAEKVEMQNAATRRQLLPSSEVFQVFDLVANRLRRASEELTADYGAEAYKLLADAVDDCREMLDTFNVIDTDEGTGNGGNS